MLTPDELQRFTLAHAPYVRVRPLGRLQVKKEQKKNKKKYMRVRPLWRLQVKKE
jgi:hypothetical protein